MTKKKIDVLAKENDKTLFEDFTTLRWVKWTKRQPDWNGSVYIRWNSKWTSDGMVWNGELLKLGDDKTKHHVNKKGKLIVQYTKSQKAIMEDMYWLEEKHDLDAYRKWEEEMYQEAIKNGLI
jgi:hypothetical protein